MVAIYFRKYMDSQTSAIYKVVDLNARSALEPEEPWEAKKGAAVRTDRLPHGKARRILVELGIA